MSSNPQHEEPFQFVFLNKNVKTINASLELHGLPKWVIKEKEIPILTKLAIMRKACRGVIQYNTTHRQFCAGQYRGDQCQQILDCARVMFPGDFMDQVEATPFPGDKVTRVVNNIGHHIISVVEVIGQKAIHFFRILHNIRTIKNLKSEYECKVNGSYRIQFDFTSFQHTKTDLLHEVSEFLSITMNNHVTECLRLIGLSSHYLHPNEYNGNRTNFGNVVSDTEVLQS